MFDDVWQELLVAGTDSSSVTVEWAMAELIRSPESLKKIREELTTEINLNMLKDSDLRKLPYLQACLKEINPEAAPAWTFSPSSPRCRIMQSNELYHSKRCSSTSKRLGHWKRPHELGRPFSIQTRAFLELNCGFSRE